MGRGIVTETPPPSDMPPAAAGSLMNARPRLMNTDVVGDVNSAKPAPRSVSCEPEANDRPKFAVKLALRPAGTSAATVTKTDPLEK